MSVDTLNQEVVSLKQETAILSKTFTDMLAYAKGIVVRDDDSFRDASAVWRKARDWKKQIETQRKAAIEPYRSQIAIINDKAKDLADPLLNVERIIEQKNLGYQNALIAAKQEEERKIREAAALLDIEEVHVEPAPTKLRTEDATTYTVTKKRFRVVDLSKVPSKYFILSEDLVEADLKMGINQIEGLEIFEETITKMRSR